MKPAGLSKRAIIYTRISTSGQEENTSLAAQFAACHEKAAALGMMVVASFEDVHSGADYAEREGLQKALSLLETDADALIIFDLSRSSRDVAHQQVIKKRVNNCGKQLVFCSMDFPDTPEGDLAFGIIGSFAQYERLKIRERTNSGKRARAKQDIQPARVHSPYGYHIVTQGDVMEGAYSKEQIGKYVVIDSEAEIVREIFERAETQTVRSICAWLTESGYPSPGGGAFWHTSTVQRILRRSAYRGKAKYGATMCIIDDARPAKGLSKKVQKPAPESNVIYITAPPIVSLKQWEKVQGKLAENVSLHSGGRKKHLLSGLLRCPHCGRVMNYASYKNVNKSGTRRWAYYRCDRKSELLAPALRCSNFNVKAEAVEAAVINKFIEYTAHPDRLAQYWEHENAQQKTKRTPTATLEKALEACRKKESNIVTAQIRAIEAGASSAVYESKLTELCAERDRLERELRAAQQQEGKAAKSNLLKSAQTIAVHLAELQDALSADIEDGEKRDLLALVVKSVTPYDLNAEKITIEFRVMG